MILQLIGVWGPRPQRVQGRALIDRELPLERFAEGLEAVENQTALGRIVLTMER